MLLDLLLEILSFFGFVYDADRRPDARRLTLGCALAVLLVVVVLVAVVMLTRGLPN